MRNIIAEQYGVLQQGGSSSLWPLKGFGVYGRTPTQSPKYNIHNNRDSYNGTVARMYVQVPDVKKWRKDFEGDPATQSLIDVLAGSVSPGEIKNFCKGYIDFFLQHVAQAYSEKVQVSEVLSDNYVAYFFGKSAPVFSYQGTLMNTHQDDWVVQMWRLFNNIGRGSALARTGLLLSLKYDSFFVSGAMTNFSWETRAGFETSSPFSFNFLVKNMYVAIAGAQSPTTVGWSEDQWLALNAEFDKDTAVSTAVGTDGAESVLTPTDGSSTRPEGASTLPVGSYDLLGIPNETPGVSLGSSLAEDIFNTEAQQTLSAPPPVADDSGNVFSPRWQNDL